VYVPLMSIIMMLQHGKTGRALMIWYFKLC
jgi:hypothetical protein